MYEAEKDRAKSEGGAKAPASLFTPKWDCPGPAGLLNLHVHAGKPALYNLPLVPFLSPSDLYSLLHAISRMWVL